MQDGSETLTLTLTVTLFSTLTQALTQTQTPTPTLTQTPTPTLTLTLTRRAQPAGGQGAAGAQALAERAVRGGVLARGERRRLGLHRLKTGEALYHAMVPRCWGAAAGIGGELPSCRQLTGVRGGVENAEEAERRATVFFA